MIPAERYLLLALIWLCWCGVHSLLVSLPVNRVLQNRLGEYFRFYRLSYNLISVISLAVPIAYILYLQHFESPLFRWGQQLTILRFVLIGAALLLFLSGARQYDMAHFLGISQLHRSRTGAWQNETKPFSSSGISAVIRHPWYLGGILFVWSGPGTFYPSTLLSAGAVTIYFLLGSMIEEHKMVKVFGDSYIQYQQQVSMLLPIKWITSRFPGSKTKKKDSGDDSSDGEGTAPSSPE